MLKTVLKTLWILVKVYNTLHYLLDFSSKKIFVNAYIWKIGQFQRKFNLGDDLNTIILEAISGKKVYNLKDTFISTDNILFIGSIIEDFTNQKSIIWGAGVMNGEGLIKIPPKRICAVRGPKSRDFLIRNGFDCPEVYGDPALLLPIIYKPINIVKKHKYGIIPHYTELNHDRLYQLTKLFKSYTIINLHNYHSWQAIIDQLCECECILSSSLHGIILSDSYNIPNGWIKLSNNILGNNFKFIDYFMSVGRNIDQPLNLSEKEITKYFENYTHPHININDFLDNAPIPLDPVLKNRAMQYYKTQN